MTYHFDEISILDSSLESDDQSVVLRVGDEVGAMVHAHGCGMSDRLAMIDRYDMSLCNIPPNL